MLGAQALSAYSITGDFLAGRLREQFAAEDLTIIEEMMGEPRNLQDGERLIGFRTPTESPFKLFFARRGQSPHQSGINTAARGPVHFVVRAATPALESSTTGAIDTWTRRQAGQSVTVAPRAKKWYGVEFGVMALGGGGQLIIPESYRHLLVDGTTNTRSG